MKKKLNLCIIIKNNKEKRYEMRKRDIEKLREELQQERKELSLEFEKIKEKEAAYLNSDVGDDIDKAAENTQREMLFYISDHDRHRMDAIEDALQKMDEGRFGICETCRKKISNDRLQAIPYARLCMKCKPGTENHL